MLDVSLGNIRINQTGASGYDKVRKIIDELQDQGSITRKEAELKCEKTAATTRRYIKFLVETGYVIQEGCTNSIIYKNILY